MPHKCPSYCHKCPDMAGQIMPGCMGTAALATDPYDLSHCTCNVHLQQEKNDSEEISQLRKKVLVLEKKIKALECKTITGLSS